MTGIALSAGGAEANRVGKLAEAVLGYDPTDPDFHANAYRHYRRLARRGGLFRTEAGMWNATSYAACATILRHPQFGHHPLYPGDGFDDLPERPHTGLRSFEYMDDPEHSRLRNLVSHAFTFRNVEPLRPKVERAAERLLADVDGELDVIADFAVPLMVTTVLDIVGVPLADRQQIRAWSNAVVRGLDPDFLLSPEDLTGREQANIDLCNYIKPLLAERRARPRNDLMSTLVAAHHDAGLTEDELASLCAFLLAAGQENAAQFIGNATFALLTNPAQLDRFRGEPGNIDNIGNAVDELLRYDPPMALLVRTALADSDVLGHRIRKGEIVWMLVGAANRDPSVFPNPDRLDLARTSHHLTFGLGAHFCTGAPLGRLESQIALSALLRNRLTLATDRPEYRPNIVMHGFASLPVFLARS